MANNDKFVQVAGPFTAKEDIVSYIEKNVTSMKYLSSCGVQAPAGHVVYVNGIRFEIGKTGIIEFNDVQITSLYFPQDESSSTLVDCIVE